MADAIDTLNRVAELLPSEARERFYATIARLRNVPEDDEYLLVLESIGFMTLVWREVPAQVEQILAAASSPGDRPESSAFLATELRKAVKEALDVPTYADMRLLAARLEEQHGIFKASIERLAKGEGGIPASSVRRSDWITPFVCLVLGAILALVAQKWILSASNSSSIPAASGQTDRPTG